MRWPWWRRQQPSNRSSDPQPDKLPITVEHEIAALSSDNSRVIAVLTD
jgi:hypothetical protein